MTEEILPILALRNTVVFPVGVMVTLLVGREKSVRSLEAGRLAGDRILLLAQKEERIDDPGPADLYSLGTIAHIKQIMRLPDGTRQIVVEGLERAKVVRYQPGDYLRAQVVAFGDPPSSGVRLDALAGRAIELFRSYVRNSNQVSSEYQIENLHKELDNPGRIADLAANALQVPVADKQTVLELLDPALRLERVIALLERENEHIGLEGKIAERVKERIEKNQREYYLRERMKVIQEELGGESTAAEAAELRKKVEELQLPEEAREKAEREIARLEKMHGYSPEATVVRTYLEWLLTLPWTKLDPETLDIHGTKQILDEDHHALDDVKDRILEFLAVRQLIESQKASGQVDTKTRHREPILCLVGPPGVGKTSLGRSIARALNRQFVRISLGGVRDEAEVRGHRRTYIGSLPGRILQGMRKAGTKNPVYLLDEIDKMTADFRGDPASALLEVLDPEQNKHFSDHYLEIAYDLSQVLFITTANTTRTIPRPLLDRMEVINLPGYTLNEKVEIARHFQIPKQLADHGLTGRVKFSKAAIEQIIAAYTQEAGVRNLERQVAKICRQVAKEMVEKGVDASSERRIPPAHLRKYLGVPLYTSRLAEERDQVGVAQGLAWTEFGGRILVVEALALRGAGRINLTGQLGEVMQESAKAAIGYLRSRAKELECPEDFYKYLDFHIHIPEGSVPKDGPSAGITIATALVSAVTRRQVKAGIAMTGEITLRGHVLLVGGIKEKLLAAHQAGIRRIILPERNEAHLEEVPAEIRKDLEFHLVSHMDQVLELMLGPQDTSLPLPWQGAEPAAKVPEVPEIGEQPAEIGEQPQPVG
ncbi:MAG: endopeptidase La [Deinococcus sp.]|nr:endopeptidase La [Deinococcus sp.]